MSDRQIVGAETYWPTHRIHYFDDGTSEQIPIDPAEVAATDAANAAIVGAADAVETCRGSLTDAVELAALSPYPTAEEQAIIDAQVSASLALFRALDDPPADVTALAASVLTLEV
jgi:preprotein translocase subunit Sec61beta